MKRRHVFAALSALVGMDGRPVASMAARQEISKNSTRSEASEYFSEASGVPPIPHPDEQQSPGEPD
jgi:hypothetical protein